MKTYRDTIKIVTAGLLTVLLAFGLGMQFDGSLPRVHAQIPGFGYRFAGNDLILSGAGAGLCFESSYGAGPDNCYQRLGPNNVGQTLGNSAQGIGATGWAYLNPPPVVALATATTGGTIPDGTSYRLALVYITPLGGETNITSTQEATQTTSGGGLSTITVTAPVAAAGAAGYGVYSTNASGVGAGNATLTELSQPITTAVCAGAFQTAGSGGPGTGPWVCPFGTNAVFTSLLFTAAGNTVSNIPGTTTAFLNGGKAIPTVNGAAYPAAIPELICNLIPTTTNVTITTIQAMGSCPLAAGVQNGQGKVLRVTGHIVYTSGAQTGTATISLTEGGITPMTVTSGAIITGGQTNAQIDFDYYLTTSKIGAAGTLEGHGNLDINLATAANGNILSRYADQIVAASSAINLTAANTLAINITMSASTTSATLRDAQVWLLN